jgi:5-methylcytosine-specific restriction endonuclease McrA
MNRPWKRRSELDVRQPIVTHRATRIERGYDAAWYRVASRRRQADCGLCQPCLREQRLTPSNDVDHIIPIHVRPDWRLEFDNTQVICRSCHRRKTHNDALRYGSSTSRTINHDQRCAREEALRVVGPPRSVTQPVGGKVCPVRSYT